jgi:hypothetical protein
MEKKPNNNIINRKLINYVKGNNNNQTNIQSNYSKSLIYEPNKINRYENSKIQFKKISFSKKQEENLPKLKKNLQEFEYRKLKEENDQLKNELFKEAKNISIYEKQIKELYEEIKIIKQKIFNEKQIRKSKIKNRLKYLNENLDEKYDDYDNYEYLDTGANEAINLVEQQIIDELCPNPDKMSYEQLLDLEDKVGNVNKGLNKDKIKKLTVIPFKKGFYQDCDKCIICQEDFNYGEKTKLLPCGHIFHIECVDQWLIKEKKCPFCNEEIKI